MLAPRLLADAESLLAALKELVEWSETLDLAYAWMDSAGGTTAAWRFLDETKIRRAVIGVHFGNTEPSALEYLDGAIPKRVRAIEDDAGTFHPKVIVGRRKSKRRAILGSSNFTSGGFGSNTEINVVVDGEDDDEFFRDLDWAISDYWSRASPLKPDLLERLKRAWSNRSKPTRSPVIRNAWKPVPARVSTSRMFDVSWAGYVELLESQHRRHPDLRISASSLHSTQHNYLGEARHARAAFEKEPRFGKMSYPDARLVAGFGPGAGWFGSMRGNGVWMNLVGDRPRDLAPIIDPIPLRGPVSNELVRQAFRAAEALPHVKIGCISRLLCMKRPDLFFTVNAGNKRRMLELLAPVPSDAAGYVDVLELLRTFPWCTAKKPQGQDEYERELWRCRVGLIDAVLYEPKE